MLSNNYTANFPETLNLSVLGSAVHFVHLGPQTTIRSWAMALNGTTINSAADVEVEIKIVGGAVLCTVFLNPGTVAGGSQIVSGDTPIIPANSTISATVTVPATIAAGSGSVSLQLSNG